jgi:hypothetical protein
MELYPWRFDSIYSHSYDDGIIFLKEFLIIWAIARYRHLCGVFKKKTGSSGTSPEAFDNRWDKSLGPGCIWEGEKFKVKTVHTRASAIYYNRPHPQHVPCGHMAFHPTAAYGAVANNLVNNVPHPYPKSMVDTYTHIMEGSNPHPAAPFLSGGACYYLDFSLIP